MTIPRELGWLRPVLGIVSVLAAVAGVTLLVSGLWMLGAPGLMIIAGVSFWAIAAEIGKGL